MISLYWQLLVGGVIYICLTTVRSCQTEMIQFHWLWSYVQKFVFCCCFTFNPGFISDLISLSQLPKTQTRTVRFLSAYPGISCLITCELAERNPHVWKASRWESCTLQHESAHSCLYCPVCGDVEARFLLVLWSGQSCSHLSTCLFMSDVVSSWMNLFHIQYLALC